MKKGKKFTDVQLLVLTKRKSAKLSESFVHIAEYALEYGIFIKEIAFVDEKVNASKWREDLPF